MSNSNQRTHDQLNIWWLEGKRQTTQKEKPGRQTYHKAETRLSVQKDLQKKRGLFLAQFGGNEHAYFHRQVTDNGNTRALLT